MHDRQPLDPRLREEITEAIRNQPRNSPIFVGQAPPSPPGHEALEHLATHVGALLNDIVDFEKGLGYLTCPHATSDQSVGPDAAAPRAPIVHHLDKIREDVDHCARIIHRVKSALAF